MGRAQGYGYHGIKCKPYECYKNFIIASEKGHSFAYLYKARCERSAYGASLNSALAFQSYIHSAKGGVALAFNEIGDLFNDRDHWHKPYPVEINYEKALYYYEIGSKLDDPDSKKKYEKLLKSKKIQKN